MRRRGRKNDAQVEAILNDEPIPQGQLEDPDDVDALRAAIELRAARTGADLPTSEVIEQIRRTVLPDDIETAVPRSFSRRAMLAAGGAVAAGAVGVAVDRAVLGSGPGAPARTAASGELVPDDGEWVQVATAEQLATGGTQRFATAKLVGFVSEQNGAPVAVSGACTHLGCLLTTKRIGWTARATERRSPPMAAWSSPNSPPRLAPCRASRPGAARAASRCSSPARSETRRRV